MNLDQFRDDFSHSAFKVIKTPGGPQYQLVGKIVGIEAVGEELDQIYDVWLVNPDRQPIGARKLNNLIAAICALPAYSAAVSHVIRRLDGEAFLCTTSATLVREVGLMRLHKKGKHDDLGAP